MKIKCINNTGKFLRLYEYDSIIEKEKFGRFGCSEITEYNEIVIGKEYLVMGIIIFKTYQAYLIDDNNVISVCPCQLFEISDNRLDSNWHFRAIDKNEDIYPFVQAIFGYPELCNDKMSYVNLIVEKEKKDEFVYFKRKIGIEKALGNGGNESD